MDALFISYNLFCIDRSNGGRQGSFRNRECLKKVIDGKCYTLFITFGGTKGVRLEKNEISLQGAKNKIGSLINYLKRYAMITPRIENYIVEFVKQKKIGLVFFDASIFGRTIKRIKEETDAKAVCYMHNVEAYYSYNKVKYESKLYYPMYKAYKHNERLAVKYADRLISIGERDAGQVEKKYGRKPDAIISVTFKDEISDMFLEEKIEHKDRLELLFVGSKFMPNVQGLKWLITDVMPYIPADLTIIGKGMEDLSEKFTRENVHVIGSVDDLKGYYMKYDAVILPIFIGSGMKVKTAEALMYGKVLFATKEALEGYKQIDGKVMMCNTKDDFINSINAYILNGVTKYSKDVRELFLKDYSNAVAEKKFKEVIEGLCHG